MTLMRYRRRSRRLGGRGTPAALFNGQVTSRMLDPGYNGGPHARTVNGTVRAIDYTRTGTARQMQPGRCYDFGGADYIPVGLNVGTVHTVAAWVYVDSFTNAFIIGDAVAASYMLAMDATDLYYNAGSDFVQASHGMSLSTWHHIAVTRSGNDIEFFVDGDSVGSDTVSASADMNVEYIGRDSSSYYNGKLFDLRVSNDVKPDAVIARLAAMRHGSADVADDVGWVLWYKCDETGTGTTAYDSSGNGNHGTISAAAISTFKNETLNDQFSFQNEVGFYDDEAGASGSLLPKDHGASTDGAPVDVLGNALTYTGQCPHDAVISVPCLTLDSGASQVNTPLNYDPSWTGATFSGWIKTTDTYGMYVSNYPGSGTPLVRLMLNSGPLRLLATDSSGNTIDASGASGLVADDAWHHIAGVIDGTTARVYLDGELVGSDTNGSVTPGDFHNGALTIGSDGSGTADAAGRYTDFRIYNVAKTDAEILAIYNGTDDTTNQVAHWLLSEGGGAVAHDAGGNDHHAEVSVAAESTAWANVTNVGTAAIRQLNDGVVRVTRYDGATERYAHSGRLTGATADLSVGFWFNTTTTADLILGEHSTSGDKGWYFYVDGSGRIECAFFSDNTNGKTYETDPLNDGAWHHITMVVTGGTMTLYVDGSAITPLKPLDLTITTLNATTEAFTIGASNSGSSLHFNGMIGAVAIEEAAWDAATVLQVKAGAFPSGAWVFAYGDGEETQQGLTALTKTGTPDSVSIPIGATDTPPRNINGGILLPSSHTSPTLDLTGGEASSPYAQKLADEGATSYDQADDDLAGDHVFARVRNRGDDRIVTSVPAATGATLTALQNWASN